MMIFAKYPIAEEFIACRWTLVRFFIVAVLLTVATLKAYQLATVPVLDEGLLHSQLLNVLVVEFVKSHCNVRFYERVAFGSSVVDKNYTHFG